jgi:hypothetical protein
MSIIYLIVKLYPFVGITFAVLCFDLMRSSKQKGHPVWMVFAAGLVFFLITTLLWLINRGDQNADIWFNSFKSTWL